jgi:hypothetical protein
MASMDFRRSALGLTLLATVLSCHPARAEKQAALSPVGPPASQGARQYAVGDQVPASVKLDDDGYPDRRYAILIVDGALVVVIDRISRRVVEVLR